MSKELLVIYGCGELGKLAKLFFNSFKIKTIPVDINPDNYKNDSFWKSKIYKIEDIPKNENVVILICISNYSYNSIKNNLLNLGYKNVISFYEKAEEINKKNNYIHPLRNGWKISNCKNYQYIKSMFSDKISREHYQQFYIWHNNYTEKINKKYPINYNDKYFIFDIINVLNKNEVFVDAGAYDGRISVKFINIVNNKYNSIYCFEPDNSSYKLLNHNIGNIDKLYKYKIALGNKNGKIGFNFNFGYMSNVNIKSKKIVSIKKLDYLKNIKPTIIKYHLEGFELEAIKGSLKTIKKYRPIIMTTTYHTKDGLCKIPMYLYKHLKNYKFLWRNHNYMGQGSIMYCIPKERIIK